MLVVTRKKGEGIQIGPHTFLEILDVKGDRIRLGIEAPPEISILRKEIAERTRQHNRKATSLDLSSLRNHLQPQGFALTREKMEPLRRFSRLFVHDINNYLTALRGETELALFEPCSPEVKESLEAVLAGCKDLSTRLDEVVAFGGGRHSEESPMTLGEFWQALPDRVGQDQHTINFSELKSGQNEPIQMGTSLLAALEHLIANAVDWSKTDQAIEVSVSVGKSQFHISVKDTGLGMDSHTKSRCLEPLYSTLVGRDGLGLAMVCGLISKLGGEVSIDSTLGQGTTVLLAIPRQPQIYPRGRRQIILDETTWARFHKVLEFQDFQLLRAQSNSQVKLLAENYPRAVVLTEEPDSDLKEGRLVKPSEDLMDTLDRLRKWSPHSP